MQLKQFLQRPHSLALQNYMLSNCTGLVTELLVMCNKAICRVRQSTARSGTVLHSSSRLWHKHCARHLAGVRTLGLCSVWLTALESYTLLRDKMAFVTPRKLYP